jgi:hypothetical protein
MLLRLVVEYRQLARRAFYSVAFGFFFRFSPFLPSFQLALVCLCVLLVAMNLLWPPNVWKVISSNLLEQSWSFGPRRELRFFCVCVFSVLSGFGKCHGGSGIAHLRIPDLARTCA